MDKIKHYWELFNALLTAHPWIALALAGAVNEVISRNPKWRAATWFQVPFNVLKSSPLGRMPVLKAVLEALDTPEPPKPLQPAA